MDKEEEKEKKSHKKLIKKIIIISLCALVVLCTVVYLLFFFTHKDPYRNQTVKTDNSNISLIEKNLIDGFKNTKDTGKYSFAIPDEDINQILLNSQDEVLWPKAESVYYSSSNGPHVYFDLKKTLGVDTRVDIKFSSIGVIANKEQIIKIYEKSMGKLQYFVSHEPKERVDVLRKKSGLPIYYEDDNFVIRPFELLELFPNQSIKSYLKEIIKIKPECLMLSSSTLFGFDIDLSFFKSTPPVKTISEYTPDVENLINEKVNSSFLLSIPAGESKVGCSISIRDINKIISSKLNTIEKEHAESPLTSTKVNVGVEDIYLSLTDTSHVAFISVFSFNGYNIYFVTNSAINTFTNLAKATLLLSNETRLKDFVYNKSSLFGNVVYSSLNSVLTKASTSFLQYQESNLSLTLDLKTILDSIPDFETFIGHLEVNLTDPNGFDLVVKNP